MNGDIVVIDQPNKLFPSKKLNNGINSNQINKEQSPEVISSAYASSNYSL